MWCISFVKSEKDCLFCILMIWSHAASLKMKCHYLSVIVDMRVLSLM